jgi:hypothetical protein
MRWQFGDRGMTVDCLCDADAVVHPDHRRKGLLQALTQLNLQEMEGTSCRYIVTLSANARSGANNLKLGWQKIGLVNPAIRIRPRQVIAENRLKSFARKIPILPGIYKGLRDMLRPLSPEASLPVQALSSFDPLDLHLRGAVSENGQVFVQDTPRSGQMADFIKRLPSNPRMQHVRDAEYFAWRYRNPRSAYRFLYWGKDELEGYLILQAPIRPGIHPVTIVDWEAQNLAVRAELLETAIRLGDFEHLTTWGVSLPLETMMLLRESGFVFKTELDEAEDYQPEIMLRPSGLEPVEAAWQLGDLTLLDLQNWDFRAIYSDSY